MKAKIHASRTKQMVMAFFDSQGMVYTNYVPRGKTVNADYVIVALRKFFKALKAKRPDLVPGEWFLHWDNASVHSAQKVQAFLAKKSIQLLPHPPYSPDLAPADFFLFLALKRELAGLTLSQDEFKTRGSSGLCAKTTLPRRSRGGWSDAKSVFKSTVSTSRKARKYILP